MIKLKNLLKEWNNTDFKKLENRWSKKFNGEPDGLTEFERKGGKDTVVEDLNVNFYSQIRGQAKYLLDSAKNLQRAIKNQNDMTTIEEIEYIYTKSKLMLEMTKDRKYQQ